MLDPISEPVRALVARSVDYAENDRIVTLLTDRAGKVSAIARGARRSRRRFGGALSLFVLGEAELEARRGELYLLKRFDSLEDLGGRIGGDVVAVAHGSYMLELARELWPAGQQEPGVFQLVADTLRVLAEGRPSGPLLRAYELKLLTLSGLMPALGHCVSCGDVVSDSVEGCGFAVGRGGIICPGCGPQGWPISAAQRALLKALADQALGSVASQQLPNPLHRSTRELTQMLVQHHLGKQLQSWEFLVQLSKG